MAARRAGAAEGGLRWSSCHAQGGCGAYEDAHPPVPRTQTASPPYDLALGGDSGPGAFTDGRAPRRGSSTNTMQRPFSRQRRCRFADHVASTTRGVYETASPSGPPCSTCAGLHTRGHPAVEALGPTTYRCRAGDGAMHGEARMVFVRPRRQPARNDASYLLRQHGSHDPHQESDRDHQRCHDLSRRTVRRCSIPAALVWRRKRCYAAAPRSTQQGGRRRPRAGRTSFATAQRSRVAGLSATTRRSDPPDSSADLPSPISRGREQHVAARKN